MPVRGSGRVLVASLGLLFGSLAFAQSGAERVLDPQRQAELSRLVLQDCGSCHGMRLTGGLGPPLTRQALADKPRDSMIATIIHGRRGTPMPPWSPMLTEGDAAWIVQQLQEGRIDVP